jgi:hypothetical protein
MGLLNEMESAGKKKGLRDSGSGWGGGENVRCGGGVTEATRRLQSERRAH